MGGYGENRQIETEANSTSPALLWTFENRRWADTGDVWSQEGFLGRGECRDSRGRLVFLPPIQPLTPTPTPSWGRVTKLFNIYIHISILY